jgi:hypothetical protein
MAGPAWLVWQKLPPSASAQSMLRLMNLVGKQLLVWQHRLVCSGQHLVSQTLQGVMRFSRPFAGTENQADERVFARLIQCALASFRYMCTNPCRRAISGPSPCQAVRTKHGDGPVIKQHFCPRCSKSRHFQAFGCCCDNYLDARRMGLVVVVTKGDGLRWVQCHVLKP